MKMEQLVFLESLSTLRYQLRKLFEAFGLTDSKLWYAHNFNNEENLDYIGPIRTSRFTARTR